MKSILLVILLLLIVVFILLALMATFDKDWAAASCMGVWALICEKAGDMIHTSMK